MAIDLDELERLAAQATPGPWVGRGNHIFCANNKRLVHVEAERALDLQTAAYIVAACNAVPELIKMYREADDEAADANSAWQKVRRENLALRERVRELEEQNKELSGWNYEFQREERKLQFQLEQTAKEAGE